MTRTTPDLASPPPPHFIGTGMQKRGREADEVFVDNDESKTQDRFEPGVKGWDPDSTYICSKFDFYLILSCHGKFDASML
ncbi:hypothetical protein AVEN_105728-1 [Araneus ventricosus]|uniref:Uncharacterized protein n=1 Tax=Araneus ventricosus TaxID=182803 RepID=A0A4Y2IEU7_ARAVE|nr:hypothetical protein AVEN_105728-1 [Araneus ventricosus]